MNTRLEQMKVVYQEVKQNEATMKEHVIAGNEYSRNMDAAPALMTFVITFVGVHLYF